MAVDNEYGRQTFVKRVRELDLYPVGTRSCASPVPVPTNRPGCCRILSGCLWLRAPPLEVGRPVPERSPRTGPHWVQTIVEW